MLSIILRCLWQKRTLTRFQRLKWINNNAVSLTPCNKAAVEKILVTELVKELPELTESGSLLWCSKEPNTDHYSETNESNPHLQTLP
jgi:hypothetical protein